MRRRIARAWSISFFESISSALIEPSLSTLTPLPAKYPFARLMTLSVTACGLTKTNAAFFVCDTWCVPSQSCAWPAAHLPPPGTEPNLAILLLIGKDASFDLRYLAFFGCL